jgi:hypothetical protein
MTVSGALFSELLLIQPCGCIAFCIHPLRWQSEHQLAHRTFLQRLSEECVLSTESANHKISEILAEAKFDFLC